MGGATTDFKRPLSQVPSLPNSFGVDPPNHHIDGVFFEALEFTKLRDWNQRFINEQCFKSIPLSPARDIAVKTFARLDQRREDFQLAALRRRFDLSHDCTEGLFFDRQIAVRAKLRSRFRE